MDLLKLREQYRSGKRYKYIYFWGHVEKQPSIITKSCFSQWYPSRFEIDNIYYPTSEHYMMAEKARLFGDEHANSPGLAKALGRQVKGFIPKIWDEHCFNIVINGNYAKFSQNPKLMDFILSTKQRILVEASPVDKIWGIGLSQDDPNIENPLMWRGKNLLGFALMNVRQQLQEKL